MLNVMRANLKSLKWILVFVIVSFVLTIFLYWGAGYRDWGRDGKKVNRDWAATVDNMEISTVDYQLRLGEMEESYRDQLQGQYEALRKALRLPETALQQLISLKLMLREARRLGLSVSPDEVRAAIVNFPVFRSDGGFIGAEGYRRFLERRGTTPSRFEKQIEDDLLIQKWKALVTAPVVVTDQEIEAASQANLETVSYDYVTIPAGKWSSPEPGESEARAYFQKNLARYQQAEGRKVSYVLIPLEAAGTAGVTDEEVRRFYDEKLATIKHPEQRRARHILLRVAPAEGADAAARKQAEEILKQLKAGGDFETLAKKHSQDPGSAEKGGDLGWFGKGAMVPEFEQAVFSAKKGDIVGPMKTSFGYHLIELTGERAEGTTPFEDVKEEIRQQIAGPRRRQAASSTASELAEAAASDPSKFETIARSKQYAVRDAGVLFPGGSFPGVGQQPTLMAAVFSTPVGQISQPVDVPEGSIVVKVTGTVPPSQVGYDQVRSTVMEDLKKERARDAAAAGARKALNAAGDSLDQFASKLGLSVEKAGPVGKGSPLPGVAQDKAIEDQIFAATVGGSSVVLASTDGSCVIVKVTAKGAPSATELASRHETLRKELEEKRRGEVLGAFILNLRKTSDIQVNNDLLERSSS